MDAKDIRQGNATIIAGAFIFLPLLTTVMEEPNSTADLLTIISVEFNGFKEATNKVVDIFIKTEIDQGVFQALLQVIAIEFGFSTVSIMFSMDRIVGRSEDTLRLAKRNDSRFKEILDKLDQMANRESAQVKGNQEKELTKTATDVSEKLSLYPKNLKEYFKKKRDRTKKVFRKICVCYIAGIILAVSGMVLPSFGLAEFSVVILMSDTAVIILGSVLVYFLWKDISEQLESLSEY